jgi:hypothetical protein
MNKIAYADIYPHPAKEVTRRIVAAWEADKDAGKNPAALDHPYAPGHPNYIGYFDAVGAPYLSALLGREVRFSDIHVKARRELVESAVRKTGYRYADGAYDRIGIGMGSIKVSRKLRQLITRNTK